jgi:serine phosphatase RsbU (regulator of sigma subunit)
VGDSPLLIAAASRPYPGESVSGDAWGADWRDGRCRIAVIDGLGHGPAAAAAATQALAALAAEPALAPDAALRRCHAALRHSRGAAMAVAWIDVPAARLVWAGVGNIEARLWNAGGGEWLATDRGIVGAAMPRLHPIERRLAADWRLLIHTDGISNRFTLDATCPAPDRLDDLVAGILARWGRATDDATVVAIAPRFIADEARRGLRQG